MPDKIQSEVNTYDSLQDALRRLGNIERYVKGQEGLTRALIKQRRIKARSGTCRRQWMRWRTYSRYVQKFDTYEAILKRQLTWAVVARLMSRGLDKRFRYFAY